MSNKHLNPKTIEMVQFGWFKRWFCANNKYWYFNEKYALNGSKNHLKVLSLFWFFKKKTIGLLNIVILKDKKSYAKKSVKKLWGYSYFLFDVCFGYEPKENLVAKSMVKECWTSRLDFERKAAGRKIFFRP